MKRTSVCAVPVVLLLAMAGTAGAQSSPAAATPAATDSHQTMPVVTAPAAVAATPPATPAVVGIPAVVLETTQGTIVIQLDEKRAPKTTANFKKLVKQGFYDGTYFHRVIANFMIQGGDPNTKNALPGDDGLGGPGYTVPAEIGLPHIRGAVATARTENPTKASSGSQFFIDLTTLKSLDQGGYTVFGQVISGMETVDKIARFASDTTLPNSAGGGKNPGKKALIKKATFEPSWRAGGIASAPTSAAPSAAPATAAPDTSHH